MAEPGLILVTGAGGGVGGVGGKVVALLRQRGRAVRAMAHHDDDRADALRALGADVVVGDLTRPADVATALDSVQRMFFSMSLAPSYLEATATVATVARAVGHLDALVAISQMTVSQMDALSMSESHHQRLHWLSEQVLNWSGLPVVHVRPTVFLDSPLFTTLAARSIADSGTIRLPFGTGRTSPIATDDVARVVATVLTDPGPYIGRVFELTGPRSQDMNGIAEEYARALGRPVTYVDVPWETWAEQVLARAGLGPYVDEHIATMARLHRENRYDRDDRHGRGNHRPTRGVRRGVRRAAKRPVRRVTYAARTRRTSSSPPDRAACQPERDWRRVRAVVMTAPGTVEVATVDDPTPGPDDVIVEVAAVGLCGTDLHILAGEHGVLPVVPGHEVTGTVVAAGAEAGRGARRRPGRGRPIFAVPRVPVLSPGTREPVPHARRARA